MLNRKKIIISLIALTLSLNLFAEGWKLNPGMFNPSGVPSLSFSQPRFADMDADGDMDLILGSSADKPLYMTNIGSATAAHFTTGDDIFSSINSLDAEMAVAKDIDNDGDLDIICGGYTGLNLYQNTGNAVNASFTKVTGFFNGITTGSNPIADLGDLDNDGDLDLVIGKSESGQIRIYTNTGSATTAVFQESNGSTLGDVGLYAYPVIADLDNDGDLDILSGKDGLGFVYYQNTGTAETASWTVNSSLFTGLAQDTYFNSPALVDLDNDGKHDLIYGNYTGPLKYYVNSGTSSSPAWTVNTTFFGGNIDIGAASSPYLYDDDGDGDLDLYTGSALGNVKKYKNIGTATSAIFKYTKNYTALKHSLYSYIGIAEANGDTLPDALVGDFNGNIYYHPGISSGYTYPNRAVTLANVGEWSTPRFIDMDKDGDQDIVSGNNEGYLIYFENQGTASQPLWSEIYGYFDSLDVGSGAVPAFADLDFDGDYDMICGNSSRKIFYYENVDGNWIEDTSMVQGLVAKQNCAPCFGDLDGDGDQDLVLGNYDGTFDYYENTREVVSLKDMDAIPNEFDLSSYPNPFNPSTVISLQLTANKEIELAIFNLNGKLINTLYSGYKTSGSHQFNWNASKYSSGIYICRLMVDGKIAESRKITLLK